MSWIRRIGIQSFHRPEWIRVIGMDGNNGEAEQEAVMDEFPRWRDEFGINTATTLRWKTGILSNVGLCGEESQTPKNSAAHLEYDVDSDTLKDDETEIQTQRGELLMNSRANNMNCDR